MMKYTNTDIYFKYIDNGYIMIESQINEPCNTYLIRDQYREKGYKAEAYKRRGSKWGSPDYIIFIKKIEKEETEYITTSIIDVPALPGKTVGDTIDLKISDPFTKDKDND